MTDMSDPSNALSIASVERDTGLSKDTLRVWERRYGFPQPIRDTLGERNYPLDQVERLRLVKRLLDAGHRPGRIVSLPAEELEKLVDGLAPACPSSVGSPTEDLQPLLDAVYAHDVELLRRLLTQRVAYLGLARFVLEVVSPFNRLVGDAWLRGRMQIYEEHAYTESLQVVLRHALHSLPLPHTDESPLALLSTFPGEQHGIGLLMAECLLRLEGCRCISLGVQTPIWDMVMAAQAHQADLVVLSFSGVMNPNHVLEGLQELRGKLPASVEIWAGGSAPVIQRRSIQGVRPMPELTMIPMALADWRGRSSASQ
ncbi:MAG: MerR family transcriptional regulator [Burkholderiaceae bacterium]|jgi:DNA-binding transcriptional MerR regulator/methylmalonyl-CoA mutase cobalamin-binding subunit